jgi:tRNA threonylcarbamoyladenosine biosynthesis protein TsaE
MEEFRTETSNEEETLRLGAILGRILDKGDTVLLFGDLGTGKTTFVKGIANAVGIDRREITSASFIIISEHMGRLPLYHVDLYRIEKPLEILDLGLEEYIDSDGIVVIEWADRLNEKLGTVEVKFEYIDENRRGITIKAAKEKIHKLERSWRSER